MSTQVKWTTLARLADRILREEGCGGLLEWSLVQRRAVIPPNWDEVARRLSEETGGEVDVRGRVLRQWLLVAELDRDKAGERA